MVRLCSYIVVHYEQSMPVIAFFLETRLVLAICSPGLERGFQVRIVILFWWRMTDKATSSKPVCVRSSRAWAWKSSNQSLLRVTKLSCVLGLPCSTCRREHSCPDLYPWKFVCALGTCALAEAVKQVEWAVKGRSQFSWKVLYTCWSCYRAGICCYHLMHVEFF